MYFCLQLIQNSIAKAATCITDIGVLFPRAKQPEREVRHLSIYSAYVKNYWRFICPLSCHSMDRCVIIHREKRAYIIIIIVSLVTGPSFPVCFLNQRWTPSLRFQVPHCSVFRSMCDVPSIAVFCKESIECVPVIACRFFFKLRVTYYYYYRSYIYSWRSR